GRARHVVAEADRHSDSGGNPDRGRGGQSPDVAALAQDAAGAEEADTGHHLRSDARRVDILVKGNEAEAREQTCARRDEGHRSNAGCVATDLSLQAKRHARDEGAKDAKREVELFSAAA